MALHSGWAGGGKSQYINCSRSGKIVQPGFRTLTSQLVLKNSGVILLLHMCHLKLLQQECSRSDSARQRKVFGCLSPRTFDLLPLANQTARLSRPLSLTFTNWHFTFPCLCLCPPPLFLKCSEGDNELLSVVYLRSIHLLLSPSQLEGVKDPSKLANEGDNDCRVNIFQPASIQNSLKPSQ